MYFWVDIHYKASRQIPMLSPFQYWYTLLKGPFWFLFWLDFIRITLYLFQELLFSTDPWFAYKDHTWHKIFMFWYWTHIFRVYLTLIDYTTCCRIKKEYDEEGNHEIKSFIGVVAVQEDFDNFVSIHDEYEKIALEVEYIAKNYDLLKY